MKPHDTYNHATRLMVKFDQEQLHAARRKQRRKELIHTLIFAGALLCTPLLILLLPIFMLS